MTKVVNGFLALLFASLVTPCFAEDSFLQVIQTKSLEAVKARVESGADLSEVDNQGFGVLYYASRRKKLEMVKFLVEQGADVNAESIFGVKVLDITRQMQLTEISNYLVSVDAENSQAFLLQQLEEERKRTGYSAVSPDQKALYGYPIIPPTSNAYHEDYYNLYWHEELEAYAAVTEDEYANAALAFKDELYRVDQVIREYASDIYNKIKNGEQTSDITEYQALDKEFYENFSSFCNPQFKENTIVEYSCQSPTLLYYRPPGGGVLVANMGGTSANGIDLRLGGTTRQRGYGSGYIMSYSEYDGSIYISAVAQRYLSVVKSGFDGQHKNKETHAEQTAVFKSATKALVSLRTGQY